MQLYYSIPAQYPEFHVEISLAFSLANGFEFWIKDVHDLDISTQV